MQNFRRGFAGSVALAGLVTVTACSGAGTGDRAATTGTATTPAADSTAATTGVVTLTGCLVRDSLSSEYTLANVATAGAPVGVPSETPDPARDPDVKAAPSVTPDTQAQAALAAASSYRLIAEDDEAGELSEAVGKRVTVRGQLAHPSPGAGAPAAGSPEAGVPAGSTPTDATVRGAAGELRAMRVQSVRAVGDDCG